MRGGDGERQSWAVLSKYRVSIVEDKKFLVEIKVIGVCYCECHQLNLKMAKMINIMHVPLQ